MSSRTFVIIVFLQTISMLGLAVVFAQTWDRYKELVSVLRQANSLLWRVARSERQYSPSACYVRMRDGLEDQIDDFIGYDEMGQ